MENIKSFLENVKFVNDEQPVSLLSASSRPTLTESTPNIMEESKKRR